MRSRLLVQHLADLGLFFVVGERRELALEGIFPALIVVAEPTIVVGVELRRADWRRKTEG